MATPSDMDTPMYMLLNLGVGGIAGTASGSESMEIDYVRAYASDASLANVSVAQFVSESNLLNGTPERRSPSRTRSPTSPPTSTPSRRMRPTSVQ